MTTAARESAAELATTLRPALLRLIRLMRLQRVDTSITLTQLSALGALEKSGPMSPGELAAYERVQPPSMTKVLAGLEERGLVSRSPHPTDRRQAIIELTDAAHELIDSERRSRDAWFSKRLATLTEDERALLAGVLPVLDKLGELSAEVDRRWAMARRCSCCASGVHVGQALDFSRGLSPVWGDTWLHAVDSSK